MLVQHTSLQYDVQVQTDLLSPPKFATKTHWLSGMQIIIVIAVNQTWGDSVTKISAAYNLFQATCSVQSEAMYGADGTRCQPLY